MNTATLYRKFQIGGQVFDEIPLAEATANADKALATAQEKHDIFHKSIADDVDEGWQHVYFDWYTRAWDAAAVAVRLEAKVLYFPNAMREAMHYRTRMSAANLPYDIHHKPPFAAK